MKKTLLILFGIVTVVLVVGFFLRPDTYLYENRISGVTFRYPRSYELVEKQIDGGHRSIVLTKEKIGTNGEDPISLSLDIFSGVAASSLAEWLRTDKRSHYQKVFSKVALLLVDDVPGYSYVWDGLYRGNSVALMRGNEVTVFSVTFRRQDDEIKKDFDALMKSVKFTKK